MKTPALLAWRHELARGERTATTIDWLFRAACAEASALELRAMPQLADHFLAEARRIVRAAAREHKQSA